MLHRFIGLALLSLVLVGCSGKEKAAPLTGDRVDIFERASTIAATPGALLLPFDLPESVNNADWPQAGGIPSHSPMHVALPEQVKRAWTQDVNGDSTGPLNSPVVGGGRLFAMASGKGIVAMDAKTGKQLWEKEISLVDDDDDKTFSGGLAAAGDKLVITTATGDVLALASANGAEQWRINVGSPVRAAPTVAAGLVFVVSVDNKISAISLERGALVWTHNGIEESLALLGGAAPAVADGLVAVAYSSGEIYVLNATDGKYVWHDQLSGSLSRQFFVDLVDIEADPVIANGVLYVMNLNGRLMAYELANGRRLWAQQVASSQMPWVAGTGIYVLTDDGQMVGINRRDGSIRWVTPLVQFLPKDEQDEKRSWSGPIFAGNRLIVASSDGFALSLNPDNGKRLLSVQLFDDDGVQVPPIVAGGSLYFLTTAGKVVSFR